MHAAHAGVLGEAASPRLPTEEEELLRACGAESTQRSCSGCGARPVLPSQPARLMSDIGHAAAFPTDCREITREHGLKGTARRRLPHLPLPLHSAFPGPHRGLPRTFSAHRSCRSAVRAVDRVGVAQGLCWVQFNQQHSNPEQQGCVELETKRGGIDGSQTLRNVHGLSGIGRGSCCAMTTPCRASTRTTMGSTHPRHSHRTAPCALKAVVLHIQVVDMWSFAAFQGCSTPSKSQNPLHRSCGRGQACS